MIFNYNDFLLEEKLLANLDFLFESGLVAKKYDFSEITDACIKAIKKLKDKNKKARLLRVDIDAVNVESEYVDIIWDPSETMNAAAFNPGAGTVELGPTWEGWNKETQEMAIAHEFSHAIDPSIKAGVNDLDERFYKFVGAKNDAEFNEFLDQAFKKIEKDNSRDDWYRLYMRRVTEVEAHVGMFVYMVNGLLIKYPEKTEKVKELLRKGDWRVDKVFPELKQLADYANDRVEKFGKVKNKMLKRLGAIAVEQASGKKPPFEVLVNESLKESTDETIGIINFLSDFMTDINDKNTDVKLNFPSDFDDQVSLSNGIFSSIIFLDIYNLRVTVSMLDRMEMNLRFAIPIKSDGNTIFMEEPTYRRILPKNGEYSCNVADVTLSVDSRTKNIVLEKIEKLTNDYFYPMKYDQIRAKYA
jgi:hypothetical protein